MATPHDYDPNGGEPSGDAKAEDGGRELVAVADAQFCRVQGLPE
ncbi:hypothetical protein [Meridianimarinicoccus roseus]|nr:hypothetical protein [Meridianimarinicoccus roseus]